MDAVASQKHQACVESLALLRVYSSRSATVVEVRKYYQF